MTRAERASLLHGIYVVVDDAESALDVARASLDAGVRVLQYRAKSGIVVSRLRALRALARDRASLLILNDDWRAAIENASDGVHLGPGDDGFSDLTTVRARMPEALIGLSCANEAEMRTARAAGADYAGVGAVYATPSKSDAGAPIGIDGLLRVASAAALPVAAIGGINLENVGAVKRSGVAMAAVISAVASAADPATAARELVRAWESA